jgi:hypothetical protein
VESLLCLSPLAKATSVSTSSHQTITWEVIAAILDPFDSRPVADQDCLGATDLKGESHAELSNSYDRLGAGKVETSA